VLFLRVLVGVFAHPSRIERPAFRFLSLFSKDFLQSEVAVWRRFCQRVIWRPTLAGEGAPIAFRALRAVLRSRALKRSASKAVENCRYSSSARLGKSRFSARL